MSKECWQNRRVEDEHELRIRDALLKALGVEPSDGMVPTPKLVVAASLQRLAVGKGLAQRDDPDQSVLRSADLPPPALTLLNGYFAADGRRTMMTCATGSARYSSSYRRYPVLCGQ